MRFLSAQKSALTEDSLYNLNIFLTLFTYQLSLKAIFLMIQHIFHFLKILSLAANVVRATQNVAFTVLHSDKSQMFTMSIIAVGVSMGPPTFLGVS